MSLTATQDVGSSVALSTSGRVAADRRLPALTAAELIALGDHPAVPSPVDAFWWGRLDQPARDAVVDMAQRGLMARNLVTPGDRPQVDPDVEMVMRARAAAPYLVICQEATGDQVRKVTDPPPTAGEAMLGDDSTLHRTLAYGHTLDGAAVTLLEVEVDGVHSFRICPQQVGLSAIAQWLLGREPTRAAARVADVVVPHDAGPVQNRLFLLVGEGDAQARFAQPGPVRATAPVRLGEPELVAWLERAVAAESSGSAEQA